MDIGFGLEILVKNSEIFFNNIHSILIERKHQYLMIIFHGNFAYDYPNYNQHKQNWSNIILLQGYKLYNYSFIIQQ